LGGGPTSVLAWMNRMPSPGRGASYMCVSTSLNSSTDLPWASTRRRKSLSASVQPATWVMNGNSATHPLSNSSRMPAAAGSARNVTVQRLSRSALENSQVPVVIALAASLKGAGVGACAWAAAANAATMIAASPMRRPQVSACRRIGSGPLFRRPRRLGDRRQRPLAGNPGREIVHHELVHPGAGPLRPRAEVGKQHDVLHRDQLARYLRLLRVDVEAGRQDLLVLQGADQRRLVDHAA